jgi:hypothetical protein
MPIKRRPPQPATPLEEFKMRFPTCLVRVIPPAVLVLFATVCAGWKWEGVGG